MADASACDSAPALKGYQGQSNATELPLIHQEFLSVSHVYSNGGSDNGTDFVLCHQDEERDVFMAIELCFPLALPSIWF